MNVLDLAHLRSITDGNPEIEKRLIGLFHSTVEESFTVLDTGADLALETASEPRDALHRLSGAAASIGAIEVVEYCDMLRQGTQAAQDEIRQLQQKANDALTALNALHM